MHDKTQRINVTPVSTQDFEMVKILSDIYGSTWSQIGARALNEWLRLNFVKEVERHQETEQIFKKFNPTPPSTLAEPDLSFKDDENPLNDPHLWRGK